MAKFFDVFLSSIGIFFVAFCWSYYILRDAKTSLLCATIVAVCASYIVWQIVDKSYKKANNSKTHKARLAKLASYLCFCENLPSTIADLLKYYSFEVQKVQNEGIVANKGGVRFYVGLLLDHDFVTVAELRRVVRCTKREGASKLIVFCLGARGTEMQLANGMQTLPPLPSTISPATSRSS